MAGKYGQNPKMSITSLTHLKLKKQNAEITLYHSGHALVLIDEKPVFDGDLIEKRNPIAKLSYYNIDDGEKISLH